jgi:predicted dehydrogenase
MRIGIVGCGKIARTHAAILKKDVRGADLVFCDRNGDRAEKLARSFSSGSTYQSLDELLAAERVDALHVLTQVASHGNLARKALEAGVHVYVEKPVTETAAEYGALLELARKSGKHLCAGYSMLGMRLVRKAKQIIESGAFGGLVTVHCDFNTSPRQGIPYGSADHWAYSLRGGILQNVADHPCSLVVDAIGEIDEQRVMASRRNKLPRGCADLLHVAVGNDRSLGSFTISSGNGNAHAQAVYFLESATILLDLRRQLFSLTTGRGPQSFARRVLSGLSLGWSFGRGTVGNAARALTGSLESQPGIRGLIRGFYGSIEAGSEAIVEDRTVLRILNLQERVWEELGKALPEPRGSSGADG